MNKLKASLKYFRLSLIFAFIVFFIMLITMLLVFLGTYLLAHFGKIDGNSLEKFPFFTFCTVSVFIGTLLSILFSKTPLRPFRKLIAATDRIAEGDYSVRLELKGLAEFQTLYSKFNHMAEELGSVEMLRTDFVNNFSHEFKTPIVSIRGFARALKWDDLTPQEREEYLDIIISESERLSELSLNVLYLSKLENQTILTDKKCFNISEQIRLAVALLDHRFSEKHLDIGFYGDEFLVEANEEMMKQVWINLLDNSIKFSPVGGRVTIHVSQRSGSLSIKISNQGDEISPEIQRHLFDKFYQGDVSHSQSGNGLGLAIVKSIVELHGGNISVHSSDKGNTFEVILKSAKIPSP